MEFLSKANLGCGNEILEGYVNVDLKPLERVYVPCDLSCFPWPFEDEVFDEVRGKDILEHLPDTLRAMEEIYRITKQGGRFFLACLIGIVGKLLQTQLTNVCSTNLPSSSSTPTSAVAKGGHIYLCQILHRENGLRDSIIQACICCSLLECLQDYLQPLSKEHSVHSGKHILQCYHRSRVRVEASLVSCK